MLRGDGAGHLGRPVTFALGNVNFAGYIDTQNHLAAADFNGDGQIDCDKVVLVAVGAMSSNTYGSCVRASRLDVSPRIKPISAAFLPTAPAALVAAGW